MRIITGHDYYDSALAYGQDGDVVFVRKKDDFRGKVPVPLMPPDNLWIYFRKSGDRLSRDRKTIETGEGKNHCSFRAELVYVWFCGKRYGGVQWGGIRGDLNILAPSYFWSYAELKALSKAWATGFLSTLRTFSRAPAGRRSPIISKYMTFHRSRIG